MTDTYNGYTNYETRCVSLWLNNEESLYRYWGEIALETFEANGDDKAAAAVDLARLLEDEVRGEAPDNGLFGDLLNSALDDVNWTEIANGFLEGIES